MRKMIIAVVAFAIAAVAQAATYNWKTGTGNQVYAGNATDKLTSGIAYLFDGSIAQQSILDAYIAGTDFATLSSLDNSSIQSTGAIAAKTAEPDLITSGSSLSAYFAVISDSGDLFISEIATIAGKDVGAATLTFKPKTASQLPASESTTFTGTGWYTAAVPEPTSGLLMLLGMAGLALRRRRA